MNDLTIVLDGKSGVPLYEQIYYHIKNEITEGGLPFGKRLPSTRKLAKFLQVSRTTVDLAYEQLVSEGYVEARPCKGYYVCELEGICSLRPESPRARRKPKQQDAGCLYDFSPRGVDLNSFPLGAWRKISKEILMEDNTRFFQLGDPAGEWELRCTIADYLHQARGVSAEPEQIIVGAGNDFLHMLLRVLLGNRRVLAMESPTYRKAYELFESLSCTVKIAGMD